MPCPYCRTLIYQKRHRAWDYYEQFIFIAVLFGVLLLLLTAIFGRHIGYHSALITSFGFWLVLLSVFAVILVLNLIVVVFLRIFSHAKKER